MSEAMKAINDTMDEIKRNPIAVQFEKWQKACALSCWVILKDGVHVATIQRKGMNTQRVTCILLTFQKGIRALQKGTAGGGGYDRTSAALDKLRIGDFVFKDEGPTWECQLNDAGFEVIHAVW